MRDQLNKGNNLLTPLNSKRKSIFQGGERKSMKLRKFTAGLLALAMVLTLVALPVAADSKGTTYSAVSVPVVATNTDNVQLGSLAINLDPSKDNSSATIKLTNVDDIVWLRAGTPALNTGTGVVTANVYDSMDAGLANTTAVITKFGNSGKEIKLDLSNSTAPESGTYYLDFTVKTSGAGEIKAEISGLSGQIIGNHSVVLAVAGAGSVDVAVSNVKNISGSTNAVTFRISETRAGAMGSQNFLKIKLPKGFTFTAAPSAAVLAGGSTINTAYPVDSNGNNVTSELIVTNAGGSGKIIADLTVNVSVNDKDAKTGDVVAYLLGQNNVTVNQDEITIAKYADFGVEITAADPKAINAGQINKKAATITIKENAPASLIPGRNVYLTLPEGVQWDTATAVQFTAKDNAGLTLTSGGTSDNGKTLKLVVGGTASTQAATFTVKEPRLKVAAGFVGEVNVVASGNAGVTGEVVIAEVESPVTVTFEKKDVRIGVRNQVLGDIVIEEKVVGALSNAANLLDSLGANVLSNGNTIAGNVFSISLVQTLTGNFDISDAKVEVLDTDHFELVKVGGKSLFANPTGSSIQIQVKEESYKKPAKIVISGVKVTLDRAVPEGDLLVVADGTAVNKSRIGNESLNYVVKSAIATVINPAPGVEPGVVGTVEFVIDAKTYTVNGVEKSMDVAPYIQDGRTMLPVRFVAEALGVSEDNIIWDAATKTVTIMKGDRIAQMTIGSKVMVVNGVNVNMDTAAAIKDGRTVLPIRFAAQALGVGIEWDDATRTVTIN